MHFSKCFVEPSLAVIDVNENHLTWSIFIKFKRQIKKRSLTLYRCHNTVSILIDIIANAYTNIRVYNICTHKTLTSWRSKHLKRLFCVSPKEHFIISIPFAPLKMFTEVCVENTGKQQNSVFSPTAVKIVLYKYILTF